MTGWNTLPDSPAPRSSILISFLAIMRSRLSWFSISSLPAGEGLERRSGEGEGIGGGGDVDVDTHGPWPRRRCRKTGRSPLRGDTGAGAEAGEEIKEWEGAGAAREPVGGGGGRGQRRRARPRARPPPRSSVSASALLRQAPSPNHASARRSPDARCHHPQTRPAPPTPPRRTTAVPPSPAPILGVPPGVRPFVSRVRAVAPCLSFVGVRVTPNVRREGGLWGV